MGILSGMKNLLMNLLLVVMFVSLRKSILTIVRYEEQEQMACLRKLWLWPRKAA